MRGRKERIDNPRGATSVENPSESCPLITLGDLTEAGPFYKDGYWATGALITGGVAPYTLNPASVPTGMTLSVLEDSGNYYAFIDGIPTTFGSYPFDIDGIDANGCAITLRSYTILVGGEFINNTPQAMVPYTPISVAVSGVSNLLGTNARVESITFNTTQDLSDLYWYVQVSGTHLCYLFDTVLGAISGTDLVGTSLKAGAPFLTTGSGTYTGEFRPQNFNDDFTDLNGANPNGTWDFYPETVGTFTSVRVLILPM